MTTSPSVSGAQLVKALRKLDVTVRKFVDCFIAAFAIAQNHELLHADNNFDPFVAHLGLRVVHPDRC